jgi:hypothetical protein
LAYKTIENEFKMERQRQLKEHLCILYNWKKDNTGKKPYLEAYGPKTKDGERQLKLERKLRKQAPQEQQERL